ncbi:hypothetical protein HK102_005593 [Quaeritorhiza haematococci]|nr:hypothetical protein HK102_005593 [Quaeritorhiza haematococci]
MPISVWLFWSLRKVQDANKVKFDICASLILCAIGGGSTCLLLIFPVFFSTYNIIGPTTIVSLALIVGHFFVVIIPLVQSYHDEALKMKLRRLGDGELKYNMASFEKVLKEKELFDRFKRFCVRDFCVEQIRFYEEYTRLLDKSIQELKSSNPSAAAAMIAATSNANQSAYLTMSQPPSPTSPTNDRPTVPVPDSLQPRYEWLYYLFVQEGSPFELNLPFKMRRYLTEIFEGVPAEEGEKKGMQMMCAEKKIIPVDVFEGVKRFLVETMFFNTFPRYLEEEKRTFAQNNVRCPKSGSPV